MSAFHARILASDTLFFDGDCEFMVAVSYTHLTLPTILLV